MIRRTAISALLALCPACLPAGHGVRLPEETVLAFICSMDASERVSGCERLDVEGAPTYTSSIERPLSILSFDEDAIVRLDIAPIPASITIEPSSASLDPDPQCEESGHLRAGRIERPLKDLPGLFETFILESGDLVPSEAPKDLVRWSLFHPETPCRTKGRIEITPFVDPEILPTGLKGLNGFTALAEDEILIAGATALLRIERGQPGSILWNREVQLEGFLPEPGHPPEITDSPPYRWAITSLGLEPGGGPSHRGLLALNEFIQPRGGQALYGRGALLEIVVEPDGVRTNRLIQLLPDTSTSELNDLIMDESGGYILIGHDVIVTSTSIDAAPDVILVDGLLGESITPTTDERYPHLIGAEAGAVALGDARQGTSSLEILFPFGPTNEFVRALDWYRSEPGPIRILAVSEAAKVVEWTAGDEDFVERSIWVPEEVRNCSDVGELQCGRTKLSTRVEHVAIVDRSSGDEILIPPDACTSILLMNVPQLCASVVVLQGSAEIEPNYRVQFLEPVGDHWLLGVETDERIGELSILELRVRP